MYKIGSSVNRVDDECRCEGEFCFPWLVGFFADEGVGGIGGHKAVRDHFFDGLVGFCYQVCGWKMAVSGWSAWGERTRKRYNSFWCQSRGRRVSRTLSCDLLHRQYRLGDRGSLGD